MAIIYKDLILYLFLRKLINKKQMTTAKETWRSLERKICRALLNNKTNIVETKTLNLYIECFYL